MLRVFQLFFNEHSVAMTCKVYADKAKNAKRVDMEYHADENNTCIEIVPIYDGFHIDSEGKLDLYFSKESDAITFSLYADKATNVNNSHILYIPRTNEFLVRVEGVM